MAARSLLNNALFNNAKVNDLTVDNLVVNNSEENKALDEIDKTVNEIDKTTKEVHETVNEIQQKQYLENTNLTPYNLSFENIDSQVNVYNTFKLNFSTLKMPRPFLDFPADTPIGLLAYLNRWTALNSTADCFGILVAEYILQKRIELVPGTFKSSFIDPTAEAEITINPMSTTYDYYSENTLKLFGLYDKILSYERLIGLTHDGFETASKYNENTNTLELRIPSNVSKQFPANIGSSLFNKERMNEIVNDYLRRVQNNGIYELTFDQIEFEKIRPVWKDLLTKVDNESGYSVTVEGKTYPVVSSLVKYLFFVHSFLPIVAKQEIDVALKNNVAPGAYKCKPLIQGFNEWYSTMTLEKLSAIDLLLVPTNLEANKTKLTQLLVLLATFNGNGGKIENPYPFHYTALNIGKALLSVDTGNATIFRSVAKYCKDRVRNDYGIDFDDTNTVKQGQSTKTVVNGKEYVMSTGYDITLTGEALKLSNSFKQTFEVVPATVKLDEVLPSFVKDLNTVEKTNVLRSEVSTMMSTMQLTNAYITGGYRPVGLYLLLSRQISTNSGAECPGVLHSEVLLQKTFVLEDYESPNLNDATGTDTDTYSTTFEQVSPSFSYFNKDLQALLNMMDKNLYAEKQIGISNTGVYAYSTFKNGVLTLAQDLYVRPQFSGNKSASFMIDAHILRELALSTKAKLLFNQALFAKEWPRFQELAAKVQEACGATITVTNKTTGQVTANKAPFITSVLKSLYLGHACTAMIAYLIQNGTPPELVTLTDKNPLYANLVNFQLLPPIYYWIPELDLFLYEFLGSASWLQFYFTAFGTQGAKKLKSEFGLEITSPPLDPNFPNISFKNDFSEGYTVNVPVSSPAYDVLTNSFPESVVH